MLQVYVFKMRHPRSLKEKSSFIALIFIPKLWKRVKWWPERLLDAYIRGDYTQTNTPIKSADAALHTDIRT